MVFEITKSPEDAACTWISIAGLDFIAYIGLILTPILTLFAYLLLSLKLRVSAIEKELAALRERPNA